MKIYIGPGDVVIALIISAIFAGLFGKDTLWVAQNTCFTVMLIWAVNIILNRKKVTTNDEQN